jgi:hypothetical protein
VPPGDAEALAASIRDMVAYPAMRRALGAAATSRAADYSVQAVGAGYRELLRAVIRDG